MCVCIFTVMTSIVNVTESRNKFGSWTSEHACWGLSLYCYFVGEDTSHL